MEGEGNTTFLRIMEGYHLVTLNKSFNFYGAEGPHLQMGIVPSSLKPVQGYIHKTFCRRAFDK